MIKKKLNVWIFVLIFGCLSQAFAWYGFDEKNGDNAKVDIRRSSKDVPLKIGQVITVEFGESLYAGLKKKDLYITSIVTSDVTSDRNDIESILRIDGSIDGKIYFFKVLK